MEKLTSGQLLTLMEKTLKDLRSATSSLESVAGAMHSNLQDGNQLDLFGQEAHPVSPSPLPETRKEKMTSDTSGGHSSISSESANLQQFLASKLPQQLEQSGSTIYKLTWKTKVTPRQWQYCQLAASVLRTSESGYSSYPTPSTQDNPQVRGVGAAANHPNRGTTLGGMARLAPYPTPAARDWKGGRKLNEKGQSTSHGKGTQYGLTLGQMHHLLLTENEEQYRLNPRFSLWLMGFPIEWAYCGERVTPLSRKSQRKS